MTRERDLRDFDRRSTYVFGKLHSLQTSSTGLKVKGPSAAIFSRACRAAGGSSTSCCSSRALSPRLLRRPVAVQTAPCSCRQWSGTGAGPGAVAADLSRRSRHHVQLLRGARADPVGLRQRTGPRVVVGVGSEIPTNVAPNGTADVRAASSVHRLRRTHRHDKGCAQLFDFFIAYVDRRQDPVDLVSSARRCSRSRRIHACRHLGS